MVILFVLRLIIKKFYMTFPNVNSSSYLRRESLESRDSKSYMPTIDKKKELKWTIESPLTLTRPRVLKTIAPKNQNKQIHRIEKILAKQWHTSANIELTNVIFTINKINQTHVNVSLEELRKRHNLPKGKFGVRKTMAYAPKDLIEKLSEILKIDLKKTIPLPCKDEEFLTAEAVSKMQDNFIYIPRKKNAQVPSEGVNSSSKILVEEVKDFKNDGFIFLPSAIQTNSLSAEFNQNLLQILHCQWYSKGHFSYLPIQSLEMFFLGGIVAQEIKGLRSNNCPLFSDINLIQESYFYKMETKALINIRDWANNFQGVSTPPLLEMPLYFENLLIYTDETLKRQLVVTSLNQKNWYYANQRICCSLQGDNNKQDYLNLLKQVLPYFIFDSNSFFNMENHVLSLSVFYFKYLIEENFINTNVRILIERFEEYNFLRVQLGLAPLSLNSLQFEKEDNDLQQFNIHNNVLSKATPPIHFSYPQCPENDEDFNLPLSIYDQYS